MPQHPLRSTRHSSSPRSPRPGAAIARPAQLLSSEDRPTAVFAYNDRMAMGVYRAAAELGLRIPEDLSVVGFDDQELITRGLHPELTSVALPHFDMGFWAGETLADLLDGSWPPEPRRSGPVAHALPAGAPVFDCSRLICTHQALKGTRVHDFRRPGSGTSGSPTTASNSTCSSSRHHAPCTTPTGGTGARPSGTPCRATCGTGPRWPTRSCPQTARHSMTSRPGPGPWSEPPTARGTCSTRALTAPAAASYSGSVRQCRPTCTPGNAAPGVPVLEADPRWYERLTDGVWPDEAWRDPWVFADPSGDGWHMLVTARANDGEPRDRGVVGHARSRDLSTWTVQPPLSKPDAGFGQLEVLQVADVDGRSVLLFSCMTPQLSDSRLAEDGAGGIWAVNIDDHTGPFDISTAYRLHDESLYVGRLIQDTGRPLGPARLPQPRRQWRVRRRDRRSHSCHLGTRWPAPARSDLIASPARPTRPSPARKGNAHGCNADD